MKKMRIPILSALAVCLIGLILGSFFDLQLSAAIASKTNGFGLVVSVIAPTIGFCGLAFTGGGFAAIALKQEWKVWVKVLFWALAVAALGITTYYAGTEYFGVNGFYKAAPDIVGYVIAFFCGLGAEIGGYFVFRDCQNRSAWISFLIIYLILLVVLLGAITVFKSIMHRPRFRTIIEGNVPFHNWWQRCTNRQFYMNEYQYISEEFKSFPSGHTGEAAILLVVATFLPLAHKKLEKIQIPFFIGAFLFVVLTGFARILAAAHFLSDVSMGTIITIVFTLIANEIAIHLKALHPVEQE